jgi:hypothetical protein
MQPNMSEPSTQTGLDKAKPPPPTRAQRLAAFGFLGAFALTILTVLLTGLKVGAPAARHVLQPAPPAAETGVPSRRAEAPSGSSNAAPSAQPVPPPSFGETRTTEDAAREDAARDAKHKDPRKDADGSRADDAR